VGGFIRATVIGPFFLPIMATKDMAKGQSSASMKRMFQTLALPLGTGAIFLLLFTSANPLLDQALVDLFAFDWITEESFWRAVYWLFLACLFFPFLNTELLKRRPKAATSTALVPLKRPAMSHLVNARSVTVSLVLFNAMFLAQTLSDVAVLSGGVTLPEGMSYATYAHRGAYPLLATALLAGGFAILTHSMIRHNRTLRMMMYAWMGQTLFLVVTAAFRLSEYVDAYSLTYLRVAAFIWMGLVMIGLCLVIVQIAQGRSVGWLLRRNAALGLITLYLCCFVNFTHLIATYNLSSDVPRAELDIEYVCHDMSPQALPAIRAYEPRGEEWLCVRYGTWYAARSLWPDPLDTWQEWGFRRWRLAQYLAADVES